MDTQPSPVRQWIEDSHLISRTGAGAIVGCLGLATAVQPSAGAWGLAALLAVAGSLTRFWSAGIISKNRELATSGPYAYVRNPLYTGSMLIAGAFLILNGNLWFGMPAVVAMAFIYLSTVESEERTLRELFGPSFDTYRERVPAIFPWKGNCDDGQGAGVTYSLEQSLHNKEYNGVLATLIMLVLFYGYAHWLEPTTFKVGTSLAVLGLVAIRGKRRVALTRRKQAEAQAQEAAVETPSEPSAAAVVAPVAPAAAVTGVAADMAVAQADPVSEPDTAEPSVEVAPVDEVTPEPEAEPVVEPEAKPEPEMAPVLEPDAEAAQVEAEVDEAIDGMLAEMDEDEGTDTAQPEGFAETVAQAPEPIIESAVNQAAGSGSDNAEPAFALADEHPVAPQQPEDGKLDDDVLADLLEAVDALGRDEHDPERKDG